MIQLYYVASDEVLGEILLKLRQLIGFFLNKETKNKKKNNNK